MKRSDLPFGSEFSPSQINLPDVLELAAEHGGDWRAFEGAVREKYFERHETSDYNRGKLANNCKLGMIAYGIIDREARLTDFGLALHACREDEEKLYLNLARHILANLHGVTLIQCLRDIESSGERVELNRLRAGLRDLGVHFPPGGKHASVMRLWLEKAGLLKGWNVNEQRLNELLGESLPELEALAGFTSEQKAFLKTLANLGPSREHRSNDVAKLATGTYGVTFNEKNLPKQVLYRLEKAGYITLKRGTKKPGRGAKPFLVTATSKLANDLIVPLIEQLEKQTQVDLRPLLRRSLADVVAAMKSSDKHQRGLALEALAFKLMRLIDLTYVATRLRGDATGGAEVDVIFEAARLVFSRWQIQCKNTARVSLDDVAKEVGLTHFLKSNVIVMITTGQIGNEARRYANQIMKDSNLCVVMIEGADLDVILKNNTAIFDVFSREARHAMKLKAIEL